MKSFYFKKVPYWIRVVLKGVIWGKKKGERSLYLTFDDGPDPHSTYKISALLKPLNVKATFFCQGNKTNTYPEVCHHLIKEGHNIANHNYTHVNGWDTNTNDYIAGVTRCQKILEEKKLTARRLYRPPYGKVKLKQLKQLKQKGFTVINWSLMPGDFDITVSHEVLLKRLLRFNDGDVIVLHDDPRFSDKLIKALPIFIETALKKGFKFKVL